MGRLGLLLSSVWPACFFLHLHPCTALPLVGQGDCARCLEGFSGAEEMQREASFDLSHLRHSWDVRLAGSRQPTELLG